LSTVNLNIAVAWFADPMNALAKLACNKRARKWSAQLSYLRRP